MSARLRFTVGEADPTVQLDLDGHPTINIGGGWTVTYDAAQIDGDDTIGPITATVVDATAWTISVTFPDSALDAEGSYAGTTTVDAGDGRVWKFPGDFILVRADRAETA